MALKVRRIVTGHNSSGIAVVKTDELVPGVTRGIAGIVGCELLSTDQMPVDNSTGAYPVQRAGFVEHKIPKLVVTALSAPFPIEDTAPTVAASTQRPGTGDSWIP